MGSGVGYPTNFAINMRFLHGPFVGPHGSGHRVGGPSGPVGAPPGGEMPGPGDSGGGSPPPDGGSDGGGDEGKPPGGRETSWEKRPKKYGKMKMHQFLI